MSKFIRMTLVVLALMLVYATMAITDDATETIKITVKPANQPPVLAIGAQSINEMANLNFTIAATDPDDPAGSLIYSVTSALPTGATFNVDTFDWTPTYFQSGPYTVTFEVTDPSGAKDTEDVVITVNEVDRPPSWTTIGDKSLKIGETVTIDLTTFATDPDGDPMTYGVAILDKDSVVFSPANMTLVGGVFTWIPATGEDAGSPYTVEFSASNLK